MTSPIEKYHLICIYIMVSSLGVGSTTFLDHHTSKSVFVWKGLCCSLLILSFFIFCRGVVSLSLSYMSLYIPIVYAVSFLLLSLCVYIKFTYVLICHRVANCSILRTLLNFDSFVWFADQGEVIQVKAYY